MNKRTIIAMTFFATALPLMAQNRDLSIGDMFELIEQNSKSLKQQKTGIAIANEGLKVADSQRLPDIDAQLSVSYIGNALLMDKDFSNVHGLKSPHFGNMFNLDVRQTLYAGGAIDAGVKLAELGVEQSSLETDRNRQNLRFIAIGQYLGLQKLANREKVVESNISLTEQLIENIKDKQSQGVALKNDVTRYELQMQMLKLNLVKIRNQRSILNHQLCNALGLNDSYTINPTENIMSATYDKDGEDKWQCDAALKDPSIKMASVGERIAVEQEKVAKSDLLPKVSIMANNNLNGPILFELPVIDKNLNTWYVGLGVQYSLSALFKSNKKITQSKLAVQRARETTEVAKEQLNNQVQSAYTDYMQSYVELETQQKNVELSHENYQVINDRYLSQLALITDMIDAANMKLDAELCEVDARINIAYAYYKIKYLSGNL